MNKILVLMLLCLSKLSQCHNRICKFPSVTTVSGTHIPQTPICSGDLIFEDTFEKFDLKKWEHVQTLGGGGNWEFQWYTNNRSNSYVENGTLFIKPTLLADERGEDYLYSGVLDINGGTPADQCTNPQWYGCSRTGSQSHILNPVKSARIRSLHSFSFCYGKIEVNAKLPSGDWLWPAIWLLPRDNQYSSWPSSGEIDIMESRGNKNLLNKANNINIGSQQIASTLHWGPSSQLNLYNLTHFERNDDAGFETKFHKYQMEWTPDYIQFSLDDELITIGNVTVPDGGFWEFGNLSTSGYQNPWRSARSKMAPFDQEFYIVINLACGGVAFFPDQADNPGGKPWLNSSPMAATDFWRGRDQWLPTWRMDTDDAAFQIDYVRVWAL